jgi:RHS repeat-associated protein
MGYLGAFERRTDPATGLVQMGVRAYDPHLGRFLSEDSVFLAMGMGESADRYACVFDDPLNRYDLDGRFLGPVGEAVTNAWDATAPVRGTVKQLVTDPGGSASQAVHYWASSDSPLAYALGPFASLGNTLLNSHFTLGQACGKSFAERFKKNFVTTNTIRARLARAPIHECSCQR